jgi:two-component system chemotaxis response regulator CheY
MEREQRYIPHHTASALSPARFGILVVDDNELTRRALKGILMRDERLTVLGEASNGASALESISALKPHLVCLDVVMPRVDGLSVLRAMREKQLSTAVVIITGESTSVVVNQAREMGANGFVVKPFNAATVLNTIDTILRRTNFCTACRQAHSTEHACPSVWVTQA